MSHHFVAYTSTARQIRNVFIRKGLYKILIQDLSAPSPAMQPKDTNVHLQLGKGKFIHQTESQLRMLKHVIEAEVLDAII
jgi:hypothetical protein